MAKLLRLLIVLALIAAAVWWFHCRHLRQGDAQHLQAHDWRLPADVLHGRVLKLRPKRYIIVDMTGDIFDAGRAWVHPDGDYIRLTGFAVNMELNLDKTETDEFTFTGTLKDRFAGTKSIHGILVPKDKVAWPDPDNTYDAAMLGDQEMLEHLLKHEKPNLTEAEHFNPKKPPHTAAILVAASYCHTELVEQLAKTAQAKATTYDGKTYQDLLRESHCEHAVIRSGL